ncbi:response regulator transcription factor [Mucilaginibacter sp. JRF]|uniref:LytR/AlgR family response regulator transcription factor n=1 Tax=Mucilaginibacter sp. JRF TaxID=2780088 RepID=UPI0018828C93|nr:LytTR family DNA-binding domain-containing protein [Mucilaginibacter sp. JRF]MBE9586855.1 response regulator transcription factor [Mucilaginibacter sp. JRF]
MNIIIIEDEPRTAKDLKAILTAVDADINVLAMLSSVASSIKWLQENAAPDLIFSDIQLGDGLSFEIFKEVKVTAPIIFCTAFDEYAINAFESNSIDYLLKPIEEDRVEKSLQKYHRIKDHYAGGSYAGNLEKAISQISHTYKQSILVHYREKIIPVKTADICLVHAANGLVTLHTLNDQAYATQYTIDQLEGMLNPTQFFRANRQFIINRDVVQNIEHYFNRRLVVHTHCPSPEKIIVSRLKAQEFLRWIEQ